MMDAESWMNVGDKVHVQSLQVVSNGFNYFYVFFPLIENEDHYSIDSRL